MEILKVLKPEYEKLESNFHRHFADYGCTCFTSPPCGYCTHEGNPANLDETDEAWELHQASSVSKRRARYLQKRGKDVFWSDKHCVWLYVRPVNAAEGDAHGK